MRGEWYILFAIFLLGMIPSPSTRPAPHAIIFNYFPVDIDELFFHGNQTLIDSVQPAIYPFGRHIGPNHAEGAGKIYIEPRRHLRVVVPHDGELTDMFHPGGIEIDNSTLISINGTEVYPDATIYIKVGESIYIELAHVMLSKSVADNLRIFRHVSAGMFIGFTPDVGCMDFKVYDWNYRQYVSHDTGYKNEHVRYPLDFYSSEFREKVESYYAMIRDIIVSRGYVETELDAPYNIQIGGTVWGTWYYKEGPKPECDCWYRFTGAIFSFIAPSFISSDVPVPENACGYLGEQGEIYWEGLPWIGESWLEQIEGDNVSGKFHVTGKNATITYSLSPNKDHLSETLTITIEVNDTVYGPLVYVRDPQLGMFPVESMNEPIEEIGGIMVPLIMTVVVVAVIVVIIKRRKKTEIIASSQ